MIYCGVVVLVIVNGQSTTDDDIDKDEMINRLIDAVKELRAELRAEQIKSADRTAKLESQLAAISATKQDAGKLKHYTVVHSSLCHLCRPKSPKATSPSRSCKGIVYM